MPILPNNMHRYPVLFAQRSGDIVLGARASFDTVAFHIANLRFFHISRYFFFECFKTMPILAKDSLVNDCLHLRETKLKSGIPQGAAKKICNLNRL